MKTVSAKEIAEMVKAIRIIGDENVCVSGVSSLKDATNDKISFLGNKKYQDQLESTQAAIVLIAEDNSYLAKEGKTYIVCENVDVAFSRVSMIFAPEAIPYERNIHPTAAVDPTAKIGVNVHVGANAVVDAGAEIGDNTCICAGTYIGREAKVGCDTLIYPNATILDRCIVGNKVIIHSGVVIGADGFGFYPTPNGLAKIPQTGIVRIDDDVEIGANTTIDRARFGVTWIKTNVKIDDQVMVGHNVVVGESSILVAQVGIAGSATLGRGVILGGKAGINGHVTVGDGVQLAGTSNIVKDTPPGVILLGSPAESQRDFMGRIALPNKVAKLKDKIAELTERLEKLENK